MIASTLSPLLAANTVTLSVLLHRDFTQTALLTGFHLCGVGFAGFLFVASARVWGKRHLYLLGIVLIIISSAWGGATGLNYKSLLWARIVQGIGLAPFEALVNASVGDLYFVHVSSIEESLNTQMLIHFKERGKRMALSNLALFGGAFFTPVVVGKITHTIGWEWSVYLIAILSGALLPLVILFVPETAYRRKNSLNTDFVVEESISTEKRTSTSASQPDSIENRPNEHDHRHLTAQTNDTGIPLKVSFGKSLLPFNGRKTDENFFKLVLRPLPLFFHPAVFWACLIQGALIGWTVMIGIVLAAIFLGPPLWFDEVKTGYMYTGPFIGAILGFLVAGVLSDWSTKLMIRRNKGVYEPEFRILLVIPQLVFGCAGLYGFGVTSDHVTGWFWPDFFFALEVMGMVLGAVASALYIVDAHRKLSCSTHINPRIRRALLTEF